MSVSHTADFLYSIFRKKLPVIQLIENYNHGVNVWIPIYTHESTTSSGLFFRHTFNPASGTKLGPDDIKTELAVGLVSEGTKKVITFIEGQGATVSEELKSKSREEYWCLTFREGVWYAEEYYADSNKSEFSYPISDVALKELGIDNVPYKIKITDPAVAPTEVETIISGKNIKIIMPPSIHSNKGISIKNRILNGQQMIPVAIEIDGKRSKWSKSEYNPSSS